MRVIAGRARSIRLVTPEGWDTRPTTDRIKETLFNILQPYLPGASFLDLYAGSGGIGIEAVSRGAAQAVLVDNSRRAVRCIEENITKTRFQAECRVMNTEVLTAIRRLDAEGQRFDVIFMDPPYGKGLGFETLAALRKSRLVHGDTLLVLEEALDTELSPIAACGFSVARIKTYKTNQHVFLRMQENEES